jgi:8-oxo-dGTP diphosphatase
MNGLDPLGKAFSFCPRCRTDMSFRFEGGRTRPACARCGWVQYLNPAPGAGVVLRRDGEVCLVRRRDPPKQGQWTLPTGFMEWDEDIEQTAVREALEETGLEVALRGVFAVHNGVLPPDQPVVVVFYDAEITGGVMRAGDDAVDVGFYPLDRLPGPIAFAAHRKVLKALGADIEV